MKAAVMYAPGGPEVLSLAEVLDPECGEAQIRVRIHAVSIEGGDTLNRSRARVPGDYHIVGYQAAGVVDQVGAKVDGFRAGDRVSCFGFDGSHAELRSVSPGHAFRVPDGMDFIDAAVVPISFGTAHACLFDAGHVQAGETVLVQAAGSGLGVAAIQIAKRFGCDVIAVASSADKLARISALGADHHVDASHERISDAVQRITAGRGVDVVMDGVGGATLQQSILSLAYKGRIAMVGAAGREPMQIDVARMQRGAQTLTGVFLGAELHLPRVHEFIDGYLRDVAAGRYRAVVDRVFPLAEAAQAHRYIESRQAVGRVVLTTDAYQPETGVTHGR